ncbi:MAG: AAA family ATPase [Planctomycetota bacterium]|nr:AAA family ATPase [Planctomycetota bacterium]
MYEQFFRLTDRPFASAPTADRYFSAEAIENARETLFRCIERAEGPALVIGPVGTGKTMLLEVLAEQFKNNFEVVRLDCGRLSTRTALFQAILFELGLPYRDLEENELRLSLLDHLLGDNSPGLLLLIDESHTLSIRLLEELRLISNLAQHGEQCVRMVLAGGSRLEERFASPKLESFNQRLAARCYLQAFDRAETREYVRALVHAAGGDPDRIFTSDALDAVQTATDGIPRLINQVCDHALILACAGGTSRIDRHGIEEAWADLQQLPSPWNNTAETTALPVASETIEFGILRDEPLDNRQSQPVPTRPIAAQRKPLTVAKPTEAKRPELQDADEPAAVPFPGAGRGRPERTESHDPLRRISDMQRRLAEIDSDLEMDSDHDFEVPEIDLEINLSGNPFEEAFADEEVVIDRYSASTADALQNRPLVQCDEAHSLAALLQPLPENFAPKLSLDTTCGGPAGKKCGDACARAALKAAARPGAEQSARPAAAKPPAKVSNASSPTIEIGGLRGTQAPPKVAPASQPKVPQTAQTQSKSAPSTSVSATTPVKQDSPAISEDDENLIIVEDDPNPTRHVTVVRKQQYRQLFANLRRG